MFILPPVIIIRVCGFVAGIVMFKELLVICNKPDNKTFEYLYKAGKWVFYLMVFYMSATGYYLLVPELQDSPIPVSAVAVLMPGLFLGISSLVLHYVLQFSRRMIVITSILTTSLAPGMLILGAYYYSLQ
ncbi:hypothetical protein Psch_03458 [Pelotomaculum schinkii]|uniref:Uncharacterized protein n=1 Tax=Pelotomaculum schinkii TaxID=78350 RepID=A0A4Y7R7G3_9FIRM|nr:hypothetical protein [Pelotomaculum schinkii]TEB04696.1 hypothetical protein Psch_03458 [Pelotomaculum schinkii]